jgi:integrase
MNLDLITKMNPIEEFFSDKKSPKTKKIYREYITYFEKFAEIKLVELLDMSASDIQNIIIKYIVWMKKQGLSKSSQVGRVAPISTFVQSNDIILNVKKISKFYEEQENNTEEDKAYSRDDLKAMLSIAKPRTRVMVLIYSSTGIRKSALFDLKLNHIEKIEELGLYKFTIYPYSKDYRYVTFCTPECAKEIDSYIQYRKDAGEIITKDSPLVRNDFSKFNPESVQDVQELRENNVNTVLRVMILKANLRSAHGNRLERKDKQLAHAFRKYFNTQLVEANVNYLYKEKFMGHKVSIGLDKSYFRPEEMLKEYVKAINNLTISNEDRLKFKLEEVKIEKSEYESLKSEFDKFKKDVLEMIR